MPGGRALAPPPYGLAFAPVRTAGGRLGRVSASDEPQVVVLRPRRIRRVCWVLAPLIVIFFVVLSTLLTGDFGGGSMGVFRSGDQIAMIILGFLAAGAVLIFTRPKVVADEHHIHVQNVFGRHDLPWEVVRGITFERGNSWVSLDLEDDETLAVMAVQATDKEHAVEGVRALRALLAANRATHTRPQQP